MDERRRNLQLLRSVGPFLARCRYRRPRQYDVRSRAKLSRTLSNNSEPDDSEMDVVRLALKGLAADRLARFWSKGEAGCYVEAWSKTNLICVSVYWE